MTAYLIRRLLLVVPTLFFIMAINFVIIQVAPGGPVEQAIARYTGQGSDITERVTRSGESETISSNQQIIASGGGSKYRGAQGLDPDLIAAIEKQYGFDKPLWRRFVDMLKRYAVFDFGDSFFRDRNVLELIIEKMPISISLGLWTTLLVYLISIPLGIAKALRDGSKFDVWSSFWLSVGVAIPSFLFAVFLLSVFAGGNPFSWFPLTGLFSENFDTLSTLGKIKDYFWHLVLPITAMVIGGFASLTMLTKNSFLDQINQQYVVTARAKGLKESGVMYGHVFRNAMLIVIAAFPSAFISILFTGNLLIEIVFSIDGLGLLSFEAAFARDYPVMFGSLFVFSLLGLLMNILGDLVYTIVDPRIDFEGRAT
jgi:microcin C transport system permease protein